MRVGFADTSAGAEDADEFCEDCSECEDPEFASSFRLLRTLVSMGSGANLCFFGEGAAGPSALGVALLLLVEVSTGSMMNFRELLTEVSMGVGTRRWVRGWSAMIGECEVCLQR